MNESKLTLGNKILAFIFAVIVGITMLILFLPVMIILYPKNYFEKKRVEQKYSEELSKMNGKNFFCYNNRKRSDKYIENEIIPHLADDIEIVYLNGRKVESESNTEFVSSALFRLKNYSKFPHLMKVRNGKLIDKSINNPFYNVMNLNQSKNKLLTDINQFFAE